MRLTNEWNRFVYRLWAPVYDVALKRVFRPGRERALELLALQPGERILIAGIGTGEDLLLLPAGVEAVGIDISREMLGKARGKLGRCRAAVQLIEGDAQAPLAKIASLDAAIMNLILSVIPDGNACLQSVLCALKPGARMVVFDKFLPEGREASPGRRLANTFSTMFGTDINRRLSDILKGCPCELVCDEPSIGGGLYRVILLRKHGDGKSQVRAI